MNRYETTRGWLLMGREILIASKPSTPDGLVARVRDLDVNILLAGRKIGESRS